MPKSSRSLVIKIVAAAILMPFLLKAQIMDSKSIVADGAQVEKLGEGYKFTEGPTANKSGEIFFQDI